MISIDKAILDSADLQTIELSYSRGDNVYERGAPAQFLYVVKKGALCRFRLLPGGRRCILQFLFRGDGFGYELGHQHRDTAQALTKNTNLIAVPGKALLAAAASNVRSSKLLFGAAARAATIAEEQSVLLRRNTATERTALFLLEMTARLSRRGQFDLPMRRRDISDYLGLSVETISRTMNELHRAKIIQFRDKRQRSIVICNRQRLERVALDASDFVWWKG